MVRSQKTSHQVDRCRVRFLSGELAQGHEIRPCRCEGRHEGRRVGTLEVGCSQEVRGPRPTDLRGARTDQGAAAECSHPKRRNRKKKMNMTCKKRRMSIINRV